MPDTECPEPFQLDNYKVTCKKCLTRNVHWVLTDVEPNIWPACPVCGDNELKDENGVTVTVNTDDNKSNVSERRERT